MSMNINHQLPLPDVLKEQYPLTDELRSVKSLRDSEIRKILPESLINLLFWSVPALQTTRILYVSTQTG